MEFAHIAARSSASLTSVILSYAEFSGSSLFLYQTCFSHLLTSFFYLVKGIPNSRKSALPASSLTAVVTMAIFMPCVRFTLSGFTSGKINWSSIRQKLLPALLESHGFAANRYKLIFQEIRTCEFLLKLLCSRFAHLRAI